MSDKEVIEGLKRLFSEHELALPNTDSLEILNRALEALEEKIWIPCSERLPEKPEENPAFENKPIELYLVSVNNKDYPFRAFWTGKVFTDGWSKIKAIAWRPLPKPYEGE